MQPPRVRAVMAPGRHERPTVSPVGPLEKVLYSSVYSASGSIPGTSRDQSEPRHHPPVSGGMKPSEAEWLLWSPRAV